MLKISEIISAKVISIFDSLIVGTIENVLLDPKGKRCVYYTIYNEKENLHLLLPAKDIYKTNENCVLIKNQGVLLLCDACSLSTKNLHNPINSSVIDLSGNHLGTIEDIEINTPTKLEKIVVKENNKTSAASEHRIISIKEVLTFSNEICIVQNADKPVKLSQFRGNAKFPTPKTDYLVSTPQIPAALLSEHDNTPTDTQQNQIANTFSAQNFNDENISQNPVSHYNNFVPKNQLEIAEKKQDLQTEKTEKVEKKTPLSTKRGITDFGFLLNRKITKNVLANNGEIIARANSIITTQTIKKIKNYGKIIELTQHSKAE